MRFISLPNVLRRRGGVGLLLLERRGVGRRRELSSVEGMQRRGGSGSGRRRAAVGEIPVVARMILKSGKGVVQAMLQIRGEIRRIML